MLNLRTRTEYSFRNAFGPIDKVIGACSGDVIGIADSGTWGHVNFSKGCKVAGKKAVLGVEISVVGDATERTKQPANTMCFIAKNNDGLQEIYSLVTKSTEKTNFYYFPRLSYSDLFDISDNVVIFSGTHPEWGMLPLARKDDLYIELNPMSSRKALEFAEAKGFKTVAASDNHYPRVTDKKAYEVLVGRNRTDRTKPMHILNEWEWKEILPWAPESAIAATYEIAEMCDVELPTAEMISFHSDKTLLQLCREGAKTRNVNLKDKSYSARLKRELDMIASKEFEDYFYVIADMISYAKQHMLVGPARGSSAGSLVCYLMGITDVDPIKHDLLFERFIDITRADLPDIDIDFQDDRREMVFEYLRQKYGPEKVAHLGTVSRYKAKSTISEVAKELGIPAWEVNDLKGAIIERSTGDSRAAFCILDTFKELDVGRAALEKYPQIKIAAEMENHARHSGVHAAGIIVTEDPVRKYCSVSDQTGAAQIDKKDAEDLNLLKIDALGLRTLSVLQDVLDQVGWSREQLLNYPIDDKEAFAVLNDERYAGIFQFEGYALQSVTRQMKVHNFEDIAAITSLARPGPLNSGGTTEYIKRHTGAAPVEYLHPLTEDITKVTNGVVVYQEQVMTIGRDVGKLSWEDVSSLRKAMSKSLGKEFFDTYFEKFKKGAEENGIQEEKARYIWDHINTMGSWAFNRSHAISYGLVSYWCCVLKSKFPLEFAAACLRNVKDDDQGIRLLREVVKEGLSYKPFDKFKSQTNWSVQEGELIGGLIGIKGIGPKMAEDIITRRELKQPLTPRQETLLSTGQTPFDDIFECERRFGHMKADPKAHKIVSDITDIIDLDADNPGTFVFFGKLKEKNLRDMNETVNLAKRGGRRVENNNLWLNVTFEDDTAPIICTIDRFKYNKMGKPIVEEAKIGDWYLVKGQIKSGFRKIYVEKYRKLT
jgi:DNA-directed DNA polymerase III PolC